MMEPIRRFYVITTIGRKFDKNGDIVKEWWSQGALKEFHNKAKCIEKQYYRYKVQDKYPVSLMIFHQRIKTKH